MVSPIQQREFAGGTDAQPKPLTVAVWALSAVCLGLLATVVYLTGRSAAASAVGSSRPPDALSVFWRGFTDGPIPPLVVFSNAAFVGRPETGIRYFDSFRDSRDAILDHYTGVGEVLAFTSWIVCSLFFA